VSRASSPRRRGQDGRATRVTTNGRCILPAMKYKVCLDYFKKFSKKPVSEFAER
jgi:hypothetical protein